ncbi:MAG: DUF5103 domain-containing protein [Melioribacteraceae bacterium]|nr:DUF5103 domain-containing protein [Melioribacteraceae bacterium]
MKIFFLVFTFFIQLEIIAQIEIKSLRVYSNDDETIFPLIDLSNKESFISIEFDVLSKEEPNLAIIFRPCDSEWNVYENPFLFNPLYDKEINLWLDKLPLNVRGANFHYLGKFPNDNVQFTTSSKWKYFIVDNFDKKKIYASGKFYVVNPEVKLNVSTIRESLQGEFGDLAILGRTISINTSFTLPDSLFQNNVLKVEIIKNRLFDYPIIIDRKNFNQNTYYEWDASKRFSFVARNIKPGNEYRQTDTRNISVYNSVNVNSKFGEFDFSDLFTKRKNDINGSSILMNWKNSNAEYLNVTFRLKPPENITKPIFLVGSFNDWKLSPEYEMYDDNNIMYLTIQLKRGLYDYQYVVAEIESNKIINQDWFILEGNFYETKNEYHIFLYYESEEKGGYEKIIGYKKIDGVL